MSLFTWASSCLHDTVTPDRTKKGTIYSIPALGVVKNNKHIIKPHYR